MSNQMQGADAEFILNSTVHQKAIKTLSEAYIKELKGIKLDGRQKTVERVLELVRQLQAVDLHNNAYKLMVNTGKLAEASEKRRLLSGWKG